MEINFSSVDVIYPNEKNPQPRKVTLHTDGEYLQINIFDDTLDSIGIALDKQELKLLSDSLQLILKNNLIKDLE